MRNFSTKTSFIVNKNNDEAIMEIRIYEHFSGGKSLEVLCIRTGTSPKEAVRAADEFIAMCERRAFK